MRIDRVSPSVDRVNPHADQPSPSAAPEHPEHPEHPRGKPKRTRVYRFNTGIAHSPVGQPIFVQLTDQMDVLFRDAALGVHGVIDDKYTGHPDEIDSLLSFLMSRYDAGRYNSPAFLIDRWHLTAQAARLPDITDDTPDETGLTPEEVAAL